MLLVTSSWLRKQNLLVFVNLTDIIPLEVAPTTVAVLLAGREFSAICYLSTLNPTHLYIGDTVGHHSSC